MNIEIIAELAQGYEGRPEQARLLMKAAATAGADVAKYQLVYADELATPDYKYYELFKTLEMAEEVWIELATYAKELNIQLNLDIFGIRSLKLAEKIDVPSIKLHGTDIANIGLLSEVARSKVQRIILGAGGAHSGELWQALEILANKQ
ncbi:MAG: N-acetylneuraminate synthase family protein, partial [Actinobacteria bacterium]|nr:N-acetylneuraminate synthase family protein [Actinomycetota bacterium]